MGDLYHYGHLKVMKVARVHSDYHVCGVISEMVVDKWISPKTCNYKERSKIIESTKCVDEVICQGDTAHVPKHVSSDGTKDHLECLFS